MQQHKQGRFEKKEIIQWYIEYKFHQYVMVWGKKMK